MHKEFDFSKLGGFPLNQQRLEYMQAAYSEVIGALASFIGDNTIVSGCVVNGSSVSDGWVIVGGELLPLKGGANVLQATILVRTSKTALQFKDNADKEVQFLKYAEFGIGAAAIQWDSLIRISSQKEVTQRVVYVGKEKVFLSDQGAFIKLSDETVDVKNLKANVLLTQELADGNVTFNELKCSYSLMPNYPGLQGIYLVVSFENWAAIQNKQDPFYCIYSIEKI